MVVGKFCTCGILMRLAYLSKKAFEGFPHRTFDYQRSIHRGFPPSGGGILHLLLENERDLCLFIGLKTSSIFFSEIIGKLPNMFLPLLSVSSKYSIFQNAHFHPTMIPGRYPPGITEQKEKILE
jgi:hypothetical protein